MTTDPKTELPTRRELPLPGVAAIAFYLFLIAGIIIVGVAGRHYPPVYLVFSTLFLTGAAGLLASFRWAWALALAAVFLMAGYNLWIFTVQHQFSMIAQGGLNLVFFLYLIRPEVRVRLR